MMNIKTLKQALSVSIITVLALTFMSFAPVVFAQSTSSSVSGSGVAVTSPDDNFLGGETDAKAYVIKILKFALTFLGIICVVFIIYGGFLYITAGGEEDGPKKGKTIIIYCIIGLVIIFASYAIVNTALEGIAKPA